MHSVTHRVILSAKVIVESIHGRFISLIVGNLSLSVSHKESLIQQLLTASEMNNQRTLDIIREDLSSVMDSEGSTYWSNKHPHLFIVMGASVRCLFKFNQPFK